MRTYRIDRSYDWNYDHGPAYTGPFPRVPATPMKDFFGIPVRSRLGIPAGLLLNSRWIATYGRLGYDILTYKTVRSSERKCHPMPNWVYLDPEVRVDPDNNGQVFRAIPDGARNPHAVTSSVSFGMPSKDPKVWMKDVARTRKALRPGQALIVSVVASPGPGSGAGEMVADFANLAAMAREAGAQMVEANLSCPNVVTPESQIYQDAALAGAIAKAMRKAAGRLPIALKVGYLGTDTAMGALLRSVNGAADALTMVNGFSRPIVGPGGRPAYGRGREAAGILGRRILEPCVDAVRRAGKIIARERLDVRIIGVGGVFSPEDAAIYFDAGAVAVMMGSAPMFDPLLAIRMKKEHPEW